MATSLATRPGRAVITAIRVDRYTDSYTLCVTNTTVQRWLAQSCEQIVVELEARDLVERGEGLVHQEHPRVRDQRARDRHAHLHAARQLARIGALEALRAPPWRSPPRTRPAASSGGMPRSFSGRRTFLNTVAHGISVGSWNTKPMSRWGSPAAAAGARPLDAAAGELAEPGDEPQHRALAAAGRAEQAQELALARRRGPDPARADDAVARRPCRRATPQRRPRRRGDRAPFVTTWLQLHAVLLVDELQRVRALRGRGRAGRARPRP